MVRLILGFVALVALSGCASAPASQGVWPEPLSFGEIYFVQPRTDIVQTDLSGRQERREDLEFKVMGELTYALTYALLEAGFDAHGADTVPVYTSDLALAERVLPVAYAHAGPSAGLPLGEVRPLENWTVGPVWMEWEEVGEDALVLIVFHRANLNTLGHQIAQMSLGAAFLVPTWPDSGAQETYAALAEPETGNLVWVERFDHKLDGGEGDLDALAADLVAALKAASE